MNTNEYLFKILDQQTLAEGSQELERLRKLRKEVEDLLTEHFGTTPTIRYGGSKSKGTMIKEAYDLDIIGYFPRDDEDAGGTLKDIYNNVKTVLETKYIVVPKTSALRLQGRNCEDCHIDVVPGRFVDDEKSDAYLHCNGGGKTRLKTNLDVHIKHVKESGVVPAIRMMKLWRVRRSLSIKHFALELMTIEILKTKKSAKLDAQLEYVWSELRDNIDSVKIEDPANPTGNDLSGLLSDGVRAELKAAAADTLTTLERDGWEAVFGKLADSDEPKKRALVEEVRSVRAPSRPWCRR